MEDKTKEQLIAEIESLRKEVAELEQEKAERKWAEEELRSSEERFKALTENAPIGIYYSNFNGTFLYGNKKAEEIVGYKHEELIGKRFLKLALLTPRDIIRATKLLAINKLGKPTGPDEFILNRKNGTKRLVEINTNVITIAGKKVVLGMVQDITERKKAEEALRKAEERFRTIFENVNDEIIYVDKYGKIIDVNQRVEDIFGYNQSEVIGKNFAELDIFESEDAPKVIKLFRDALKGGEVVSLTELEIKHKNGNKIPVEVSTRPIKKNGELEGFLNIVRDITERKRAEEALRKSEEKYRKQFDEVIDAIFVADAETSILIDCNRAACELVGWEKAELVGKPQRDLHPPGKTEGEFSRTFKQHLKEKEGQILETQVITKKGEIKDVAIKANLFELRGRKVLQGSFRDITERKRAEEGLRASEQNFRSSLDNSPLGIRIVSAEGETLYVNQVILDIYGYSSLEELEAVPRSKRYTPESYVEHQERKEKRKLGKFVPPHYEISIVRKDGEVRQMQVFRREVMWGGKTQFQVIYHDITEQKKAGEELQRSEGKYRALFENKLDGVFVLDAETMRVVLANQAAVEIYGFNSVEGVIGVNPLDFIHPDDRERALKIIVQDMFEKDLQQVNEFRTITKDGEEKWISTVGTKIEYEGKLAGLISFRDITERKKAEELYMTLANSSQVGVYIVQDGKFQFVNPKFEEYTGFSQDELLGTDPLRLVHSEDRKMVRKSAVKMLKGKRSSPYEFRIITKGGEIRWIMETVTSIRYRGERAALGNYMDITEQKEARNRLEELEALESSTLGAVPHAVIGLHERRIVFANKGVEAVFGWKPEELIGKTTRVLYRSEEEYEEIARRAYPVLERQQTYSLEFPCRRKDGRDIICLVSDSRIGESLVEKKVVVTYEDISERKRVQERLEETTELLQSITDSATEEMIIATDPTGSILNWNEGARRLLGYEPEEVVGKESVRIFHTEEYLKSGIMDRNIKNMIATGKPLVEELTYVAKDGRAFPAQEIVTPRFGEGGEFIGMLGLCRDITERKRAEEEIKRRAAQAMLGYEVSQRVSSKLGLDELLSEIVTAVCDAFDYYSVMILLVDEEAQRLTMQSIAGGYADIFPRDLYHAIGEGMTGYAAASGKTQVSGDVSKSPHYVREADEETKSELAVPIKKGQKVIGVLDIQSDEFDAFDETDVMLIETLADQIAVAIENARLYEAVQQELAERKQAEEEIKYQRKYFQSLFESSPEAVVSLDTQNRVMDINPVFEKIFGYALEDIKGKDIDDFILPRGKEKEGRGFAKRVIRGEVVVAESVRKRADARGIPVSILGAPIILDGKQIGTFAIYRDITERKKAQEQLEHSFIDLAETVSRAMASRDPYTAGHQQRVAKLACLVGEKMGLDKDRLKGLYIGGLLHDIGKISTPESILAKPGRLSDEEWSLIHAHAKQGYIILKGTNLPWPVADMALHHHERLDGSGYPHGISGDKLNLEVRILGVCDVVEAMSSRRPYRSARSKEEVLEEIKNGRGTKYAPDVVDVMLEIIEGGEFELSEG